MEQAGAEGMPVQHACNSCCVQVCEMESASAASDGLVASGADEIGKVLTHAALSTIFLLVLEPP